MQMLPHNTATFHEVQRFIAAKQNVCIVNPCGSGKTSIIEACLEAYPESTFSIITKQKNAKKYYQQRSPLFSKENVHICTYNKLYDDYKNNKMESYNTSFLVIDEAHYMNAPLWSQAFSHIMEHYAPVMIGLTATPTRRDDVSNEKDILERFFNGNTAGNFTEKQLAESNVFVEPDYVSSIFMFDEIAERKIEEIEDSDISDYQKENLKNSVSKMVQQWNDGNRPDKILRKYIPDFMYKKHCNRILVYISSIDSIDAAVKFMTKNLKTVFPGKQIKPYVYTYKSKESELTSFLKDDNAYIKMLFSIDKIMETVHIDDVRVVVMLRPSQSKRVIIQQMGRLNSITNTDKPIIMDFVSNLPVLTKQNEIGIGNINPRSSSKSNDKPKPGRISFDFTAKCLNLFTEVDKSTKRSKMYDFNGFTATLSEHCDGHMIYHTGKDEWEIIEKLTEEYGIEECFRIIKTDPKYAELRLRMPGAIEKPWLTTPGKPLNEAENAYVKSNIGLVERFIQRRKIEDEDIKQELWLAYFFIAQKEYHNTKNVYSSTHILTRLRTAYINIMRERICNSEISTNEDISQIPDEHNLDDMLAQNIIEKEINEIIGYMSEYIKSIISMYFGLNGETCQPQAVIAQKVNHSTAYVSEKLWKTLSCIGRARKNFGRTIIFPTCDDPNDTRPMELCRSLKNWWKEI